MLNDAADTLHGVFHGFVDSVLVSPRDYAGSRVNTFVIAEVIQVI